MTATAINAAPVAEEAGFLAGRRSAGLDALRGIAVAMVVGFHFWSMGGGFEGGPLLSRAFAGGLVGVDLFFLLSGFLLGGQLMDYRGAPGALTTFYARRAARILPLYAILVALIALAQPSIVLAYLATMTQNFAGAFFPALMQGWAGPTWSLAVEEQFYLILPALIFLVPAQRLPALLAVTAAMSLCLRLYFIGSGQESLGTCLLPCRLDSLSLGVLIACYGRRWSIPWLRLPVPASLAWLGRRSYCVYLFHAPLGALAMRLAGTSLTASLLAIGLILAFAELTWRALEAPILSLARRRWSYRRPSAAALSARTAE